MSSFAVSMPSSISLLQAYMDYATQKQAELSKNIANLNTPGYKAIDLASKPETFDGWVNLMNSNTASLALSTTSSGHMSGNVKNSGKKFKTELEKDIEEVKPNGNNVSLRQQSFKISDNKKDFEHALKAYKSSYDLMNIVVGGSGSG